MENFLRSVGALYDPTRVSLLAFFDRYGPACVCDLEHTFAMGQSRLSRHLKILKEAGFLAVERRGRRAWYGLANPLGRFEMDSLEAIRRLDLDLPEPLCESGEHHCAVEERGC